MSQSPAFSYDFVPAKTRKNRRNRNKEKLSPTAALEFAAEALNNEEWFSRCRQILAKWPVASSSESRPTVICLGLGSPTSSPSARAQLAFLLNLCDMLTIEHASVQLYDPVFTDEDHLLFGQLGLSLLPDSRRQDYRINDRAIFFMPHCDIELYESVLRSNWDQTSLENMFLICNSLATYVDNNPSRVLEIKAPCLRRIVPYLASESLPPSNTYPMAFNDTSLQHILVPTQDWFSGISVLPTGHS